MSIRRTAASAIALLLTCASASALQASDTTLVNQGARVRVTYEQGTPTVNPSGAISYQWEVVQRIGEITAFESDTLVFLPEDAETAVGIPRSKIDRIEVSQGSKSNVGKGAWIGAASGLAAGLGFFGLVCASIDGGCTSEDAGYAAVFGLGGSAFGAGVGAGVGAASGSERWAEAELPSPPPVALGVGKDGSVRLAFSLRL